MPRARLAEYRRKRDFARTAEPAGGRLQRAGGIFVVQKHAARQLHHDFRLEIGGVLVSWAVPRGPSFDPLQRRLAVRTEDHPLEYGTFEGIIPAGEYGGGTVMLWDRGTYVAEGDPKRGLKAGKLKFWLNGERLEGEFNLVRIGDRDGKGRDNWLLIKGRDEYADAADPAGRWKTSVATGRTMEEIAASRKPVARKKTAAARRKVAGKKAVARNAAGRTRKTAARKRAQATMPLRMRPPPAAALPAFVPPQLATLVDAAPEGDDWLHEVKYDGYRLLAAVAGDRVRLHTRSGQDWTERFAAIADALRSLKLRSALLDGEVVVADARGRSSFGALQQALKTGKGSFTWFVFDLLQQDGRDLRALPLVERKARLRSLLGRAGRRGPIRFSDHVIGHGPRVAAQACRNGLEGIVSKRADAPYHSVRTHDWLKIKCGKRQEFVVGGWSPSTRGRRFASLLLGTWQDGKLVYAGRVGAGYDEADLDRIGDRLKALATDKSPFAPSTALPRRARWVKPRLVAEVGYTELTGDGLIRHGVFAGLRDDKPAREVTMERSTSTRAAPKRRAAANDDSIEIAGVRLTHPDKLLDPQTGLTKRALAEYFVAVAPQMLPHVKDRPVSLVRCPDGRRKACFFQRHATDGMPAAIGTVSIREKVGTGDYLVLRDRAGLVACAQVGALELHVWGVRKDDIERPDRLVFDLDPAEGLGFAAVRSAARELNAILADAGLVAWPLVTGGKGVHLVIPLQRRHPWPVVSAFAKGFAERIAAADPDRFVATMSKARRKGRIFIDHFRNQRSASAIVPWSPRARDGAPVAVPADWPELARLDRANAFDLAAARRRAASGKDPWEGYFSRRQALTAKIAAALGLDLDL